MKKFISGVVLFGILGFGFHHILKPGYRGAVKSVKIAKKVII